MADHIDAATTVHALLQMAGVAPDEPEVAALVAAFTEFRGMVDMLYAMPGVRYEDPALVFDARP